MRVTCLGLNLLPLSLLGDPGPQFLYLHSGANKFCLTSAHELLGEFDESLKGIWESLGGRGLGGSPWGRKTQSLQSQGHDPSTSGSPSHGASVSLYPADEGAEARGEDALADPGGRDLCPEASTSLGAAPRLPTPPDLVPHLPSLGLQDRAEVRFWGGRVYAQGWASWPREGLQVRSTDTSL